MGLILDLKNWVPAVVIDLLAGGAKVQRQADTIGWSLIFAADAVNDDSLQKAFDYCLTASAKAKAKECSEWAAKAVYKMRQHFISALK